MPSDALDGEFPSEARRLDLLLAFLEHHLGVALSGRTSGGVHDGWLITVEVFTSRDSAMGELAVSIAPTDHDGHPAPGIPEPGIPEPGITADSVARLTDIMARFRAVPPTSWHIAPSAGVVRIHAQVETSRLSTVFDLQGSINDAANHRPRGANGPGDDHRDRPAHIVRETELVQSLVDGLVVRSMCGYVFVPTETGERARDRPVCATCALVVKLATTVVERPG